MAKLDSGADFKRVFNQSNDKARLIVALSPTRPVCARGASALENALERYPRADVRVLVVWMPALPTDRNPPSGATRPRDPRVVELWDPRLWLSDRVLRDSAQARK